MVVTISGTNFSPTAAANIVYFGAVQAAVLSASPTSLQVTVPVSATFAPITVTVNGLTAYANAPFLPTFLSSGAFANTSLGPQIVLPAGSGPNKVVIADLDGDGKPDLIVGNDYGNTISLYRNISASGSLTTASFAPPVTLVTPPGSYSPYGLVVADVDGDGKLDIIVSDYSQSLVSVYRNTCTPGNISSNSFATRVDFATGTNPQGVEVRDLDGDGKPDLLVANVGDGTVSIFRNTSVTGSLTTNSFAPRVDIPTGAGCDHVVVADLDGDGLPDIVTANLSAGTLSVLRNLSTPGSLTASSFAAAVNLPVLSDPVQLAIGDLDGDGKPDIIVTFYLPQTTVSVLRNISTVGSLTADSFAARVDFPLGGRGHTPAIADLDGDGKPDLAVVTELNSLLSIFRNVSAPGGFTSSSLAPRLDFATGYNAWGLAIGDLDGDGRPDLVFANSYGNTISIYQNQVPFGGPPVITTQPADQTATVGNTVTFNVTAGGSIPLSYQWSFNGTNINNATNATLTLNNVQLGQSGNYSVQVANNAGSTNSIAAMLTVNPLPPVPVITSYSPQSGTVGMAVTISGTNFSPTAAANIVYFGAVQAAVLSASPTSLQVAVPVSATFAPITVTVNGLTGYANAPFLPTFAGAGTGISTASFDSRQDLSAGSGAVKIVIADIDGDGKPDLVVPNTYGHSIFVYRNISTNGSLTAASFATPLNLATPPGVQSPYFAAVADVDGDGKLDIIVSDYGDNLVSIYRNTSTPGNISSNSFAARVDLATGKTPIGFAVRDLDGDGRPEIVTANSGGNGISVLRNLSTIGNIAFAPKVDFAAGTGAQGLAIGDLDGDGLPDVVTANGGARTLSLLRNISTFGNIAFPPKVDIAVLSQPVDIAIGDLDGDGKPDLTVTFYLPQTVSVLRNTGTVGSLTANSFAPMTVFALAGRGHTPAIADLDGDGKPDIAVATELNSALSIFQNVGTPGSFTTASLAARVDLSTGYNAWGVAVGDLDGDGRPDVAFANAYDNTISLYRNIVPVVVPPVADATATVPLVISANNSNATVVLNGSLSSDPNGRPLQYTWYQTGSPNPLATGVIAVVVLPVGTNSITLMVSDGLASSRQTITVAVITLAQAVDQLEAVVNADVAKQQCLIAILNAALGSIDRSNPTAAINQLQAFQNQVSAQISPLDSTLANTLIDEAQNIINTLSAGPGAPHKALKATARANGRLHLNFSGIHQQTYIVEASTNLVDWQMIGVANDNGDGSFDFDDAVSTQIPARYYRVVVP